VDRIDRRLEAVRAAVAGRPRPATAVLVGFEPLVLAGPDSYLGQLVDVAGGTNVAAVLGGKWPRAGWELVLASAPQVVFDLSAPMSTEDRAVEGRWSRYPQLPAVRDGRIHRDPAGVLLRPGPRVADAAETMARAIHPDVAAWTRAD
jgi:iron complex transport system substrate-binding protein